MIPKHKNTLCRNLTWTCILVLLGLLATANCVSAAWQPGDELPDLSSYKLEGDGIPDLNGKVVLVDFWATWCVPCKVSFPSMIELAKTFGNDGFIVLAISVDKKADAFEKWRKRYGANIVMVRDIEQKLVADAAIGAMPTSFLVNADGRIVSTHSGFVQGKTDIAYKEEISNLLGKK